MLTILYADCPWRYNSVRTGGSMKSGAAQHYPTMSVAELAALPVKKALPGPGLLFLWTTVPFGSDPYTVMKAWGYTYKTAIFWHKTGRKGLGYWFRGAVEVLLVGTRGTVPPFRSIRDNLIAAPVEGHSQKPEVFRQMIDEVTARYADRRRIEFFARTAAEGWESYGFDFGHDLRDPAFWPALPVVVAPHPPLAEVGPVAPLAVTPLDAAAVRLVDEGAGL